MRCLACNSILTDFESTRKSSITGLYIDLCNHCIEDTGIEDTSDRYDLEGKDEHFED